MSLPRYLAQILPYAEITDSIVCLISWAAYLIFVVGFHSKMKRSDADKLTLGTESPKQEIAMSLDPSIGDPKAEKVPQ